jgi:hypothetical protein
MDRGAVLAMAPVPRSTREWSISLTTPWETNGSAFTKVSAASRVAKTPMAAPAGASVTGGANGSPTAHCKQMAGQ